MSLVATSSNEEESEMKLQEAL